MKTFAIVNIRVFGTWTIMILWIALFTMLTSSEFNFQVAAIVSVVCTLASEMLRIECRVIAFLSKIDATLSEIDE